jgi:general secretion pathway protein K
VDLKILGNSLRRPLTNNRGIAIMIAVACLLMITYIAIEVTYDTSIEYAVNSNGLNRLKSYYAAKAGVDIALLRIKVFQKVQNQFGKQLGPNADMLNEIWRMPFAWPLPVPDDVNAVDKDAIKEMVKDSTMDASYIVTIEDEGSKIDLNDLASPSQVLRDNARNQLLAIFTQKLKTDEEFNRKYSSTNFDDLISSIQGWMTSTSKLSNGQDKRQGYEELNSSTNTGDYFPPNRAFRSIAELHMVPMMNDDFYALLEPVVTIYGMKGINPNIATKDVLKSLDAGITDEVADELIKRREDPNLGGPYKDSQDFWSYATGKGARLEGDPNKVPLIFDSIMNFRIKSIGQYASVSSEITAIVMDFAQTAGKMKGYLDKEKPSPTPSVSPTPTPSPSASNTASDAQNSGPPRIVYWNEK